MIIYVYSSIYIYLLINLLDTHFWGDFNPPNISLLKNIVLRISDMIFSEKKSD